MAAEYVCCSLTSQNYFTLTTPIKKDGLLRQPIKKDGLLRQPIACYEIAKRIYDFEICGISYDKYNLVMLFLVGNKPCYVMVNIKHRLFELSVNIFLIDFTWHHNTMLGILTCSFGTSCYSTRLSWAHTPVINWVVCLGQMVSS